MRCDFGIDYVILNPSNTSAPADGMEEARDSRN